LDVDLEREKELIDEKALADAPIAVYKGEGVQKGTGRFGPFIKWDGLFINVSKKYDFDNLSQADIEALIEDKLQKNIDKVLHNWEDEGILVEKARWGRSVITKGKIKIELSKDVDAAKLTLEEVQEMIAKKTPAKKVTAKKAPAKKLTPSQQAKLARKAVKGARNPFGFPDANGRRQHRCERAHAIPLRQTLNMDTDSP